MINSSADLAGASWTVEACRRFPGEAFGTNGYLRLSYALSDADLVEGDRIKVSSRRLEKLPRSTSALRRPPFASGVRCCTR